MDFIWGFLESSLRMASPLCFGALGALMSERSGVMNIAIEGMMLCGAFTAAVVAYYSGSASLGFLLGGVMTALFALIYAICVLFLRADQIIAGVAINLLAGGMAPFLSKILFGSSQTTPTLSLEARFSSEGTFAVFIGALFITYWLYKTPSGLWLQFAGDHPKSLDAAGISTNRVRFWAVAASGFLAGLGGGVLSLQLSSSFTQDMTAGRGFMALAALIMGRWCPLPTVLACLFFGALEALQIRLQGVSLFGGGVVPVQFIQILPYVATILVLVWGRRLAPASAQGPLTH